MSDRHAHAEIIDLWPTAGAFARDVGQHTDKPVSTDNVRQMRKNGIPERFWHATVTAVQACGFGVQPPLTYARLAELAKPLETA